MPSTEQAFGDLETLSTYIVKKHTFQCIFTVNVVCSIRSSSSNYKYYNVEK